MITMNSVQKPSLPKFEVRLHSLDDRMSEQVEIIRSQGTKCEGDKDKIRTCL